MVSTYNFQRALNNYKEYCSNHLKAFLSMLSINEQFVPHRKHSVLPLERHDSSRCSIIYLFHSLSRDKPVVPSTRVPHGRRSGASSLNFQHRLCPFRSSSISLHLPPLLLITSILPSIFPSIRRFRRQFLLNMWPNHLASLFFIVHNILYIIFSFSLERMQYFFISHAIGATYLVHPYPAPHLKTSQVFLIYFPSVLSFSTYKAMLNVAFY